MEYIGKCKNKRKITQKTYHFICIHRFALCNPSYPNTISMCTLNVHLHEILRIDCVGEKTSRILINHLKYFPFHFIFSDVQDAGLVFDWHRKRLLHKNFIILMNFSQIQTTWERRGHCSMRSLWKVKTNGLLPIFH